ncbi:MULTISPECIES: HNH endonuclease [Nocardiaceae]|uniref:HNH endonuclease n=1 Tax=Nocardiaceae TaxID=85025 RepID=UPI0007AAA461|nr:hypothetical protein A3Q40_02660 [Rhodococcus sp. PBTS 1]
MDQLLAGDGLSPNDIRRFLTRIAAIVVDEVVQDGGAVGTTDDAATAIDTITALEELKAAAAGAQAVLTTRVADTIRQQRRDAPIRHHDHIRPHEDGGPTTADNGLGLCAACNHAKQGDGWTTTRTSDPDGNDRHTVEFRTPTGHTYRSISPSLPIPWKRAG